MRFSMIIAPGEAQRLFGSFTLLLRTWVQRRLRQHQLVMELVFIVSSLICGLHSFVALSISVLNPAFCITFSSGFGPAGVFLRFALISQQSVSPAPHR